MEHYVLEEVMSGDEPGWWVTLGFTSALTPNDVLHVVASEPVGSPAGSTGRVYLERFDQLYSADPGAIGLRASRNSVDVELTAEGERALAFKSRTLVFDAAERLPAFSDALRILDAMERAGYPVRVDRF